jgi:hypothetical protein
MGWVRYGIAPYANILSKAMMNMCCTGPWDATSVGSIPETLHARCVAGAKMDDLKDSSKYFTFFAQLGRLFEARFLRPTWNKYPSRETNDWDAVGLFLAGYAFERQGAKPDYHHIAADVVAELARQRVAFMDKDTPQISWDLFCRLSGKANLNYANNPLCPQSTSYIRKTGSSTTYNKSIIEFLHSLSVSGLTSNIVLFAREGLQLDCTKDVHAAIQDVNGIGSKIASLFLRDVAIVYDLEPSKDRHLLQPVDVWVKRVFEKLASQKAKNEQDFEPVQKWIMDEAAKAGVRAEAVNSACGILAAR